MAQLQVICLDYLIDLLRRFRGEVGKASIDNPAGLGRKEPVAHAGHVQSPTGRCCNKMDRDMSPVLLI